MTIVLVTNKDRVFSLTYNETSKFPTNRTSVCPSEGRPWPQDHPGMQRAAVKKAGTSGGLRGVGFVSFHSVGIPLCEHMTTD